MTIKEEFDWYCAKRDDINAGHLYDFVIIKDHSVLGYFATIDDAIMGTKGLQPGTFMIHQCNPLEEDIMHCYNREVRFA